MLIRLITKLLILLINLYQAAISPYLGANCRFTPTCSVYSLESIKHYGLIKGLGLTLIRLLKCHPLGGKGYDPVKKS